MPKKRIEHIFIDGVELKRCSKSKDYLPLIAFAKNNSRWDGLQDWCKICKKGLNDGYRQRKNACQRKWYLANIEKAKEQHRRGSKKWAKNNHDKCKKQKRESAQRQRLANPEVVKEKQRSWRKANPERMREAWKKGTAKYLSTPKGRIVHNLRCAVNRRLKYGKESKHTFELLGYTANQLIKHLAKTMPDGYTWDDYVVGKLHLDHKIPISIFNFEKIEDEDFKRCWALKNLQLLPALDNLIKHNKIKKPFQPSLIFT